MTHWHEIQPQYTLGRYDKWYDRKKGVVYGNVKGKMLGLHVLLCAHASVDIPSPFTIVWTCTYEAGKRSLCLP